MASSASTKKQPRVGSADSDLYVFIVCFLLAGVFWLLNQFSNNFETILTLPVSYEGFPEGQVVMNELPNELSVEVSSYGFNLVSHQFGSGFDTIVVKSRNIQTRTIGGASLSYTPTRMLMDQVPLILGNDIKVNRFIQDSIFYEFDQKKTKLLSVELLVDYEFEKQYTLDGKIRVEPEMVKVTGPKSILDTMRSIDTAPMEYKNVNSSITEQVGFSLVDRYPNIDIEPKNVTMTLPVEKFTEASIEVPVIAENLPDTVELRTYPGKVVLRYNVTFSNYDKVDQEQIRMVVNYNDVLYKNPSKLKVQTDKLPEFMHNVQVEPEKVEYVIKKKR